MIKLKSKVIFTKKKILILLMVLAVVITTILFIGNDPNTYNDIPSDDSFKNSGLISVLVDGVEQSAFPSKGSAEYQSTSCTNGETAVWDATNWKLSIQDISASTRCVVSFVTGGHNVYVSVSGGTVDSAPKNVAHNGNVTFTVAASNSNYVFSSAKCSGANGYSWANNVLSVNGVVADAYCDVVFSRPTYTVYFTVVGGYTEANYLTVVRGGGNSTTFGAVPGYLMSGSTIKCDTGITGKITGERIVLSNVLASVDCEVTCAKDSSSYLPGGAVYNVGDEVSYANLAWLVVGSTSETVTLILKANATYESTSSSNTTGTGIFGSGVTYTSSSARSYLVDIWLEQDAQKYLRTAIQSEGLQYQEDANGYVRLPYISEVNKKIPNASGTNFWTMDNDGNGHVYYGQPDGYGTEGLATDGKYYFEHYTLATNTSVSYSATSGTKYYATTCAYNTSNKKCNYSSRTCYQRYCGASGSATVSAQGRLYNYLSCAGTASAGGYGTYGCDSTCSAYSQTLSLTVNPYSGNSYNGGQYSLAYRKWVKNAVSQTSGTSQTATINTSVTYSGSTTDGNNDMTTAVQAVTPVSSSARINDTAPTSANQTLSFSKTISGTFYQGYNASSCDNIKVTSFQLTTSKTYTRYTLSSHKTSTMGYRPVIVVYKAN